MNLLFIITSNFCQCAQKLVVKLDSRRFLKFNLYIEELQFIISKLTQNDAKVKHDVVIFNVNLVTFFFFSTDCLYKFFQRTIKLTKWLEAVPASVSL